MVCCKEENVFAAAPRCELDTSEFCPEKKEKASLICGKRADSMAIRINGGAY